MNKIISKEHFSEKVFKLVIEAPLIAKSRKAGHFVIVRVGEKGERMPLTIAEPSHWWFRKSGSPLPVFAN